MTDKTALCVDTEELLDYFFWHKYSAKVEFDGEFLVKGRDYSEIVIPYYEITEDKDGALSAMHEIILEEED